MGLFDIPGHPLRFPSERAKQVDQERGITDWLSYMWDAFDRRKRKKCVSKECEKCKHYKRCVAQNAT